MWIGWKFILLMILLSGLSWGIVFLAVQSEGVIFVVNNTEYALTVTQFLFLVGGVFLISWLGFIIAKLLFALLALCVGDTTPIAKYFETYRTERGLNLLTDSLSSLASGESKLALQKAKRAERLLRRPDLTSIITAQAADIAGDTKEMDAALKALLLEERSYPLGVRGFLRRKLRQGDMDAALIFAQKEAELRPRHQETNALLLRLQIKANQWEQARQTILRLYKYRHLTRAVCKRYEGFILTANTREIYENKGIEAAQSVALEAIKLVPDFALAARYAAQAHQFNGKDTRAKKILEHAWKIAPHPEISTLYAEFAPDDTPHARLIHFAPLLKATQKNTETVHLLEAKLAIDAGNLADARQILEPLCDDKTRATRPILRMMAKLEQRAGAGEYEIRQWLEKAFQSPLGEEWICRNCHVVQTRWVPMCVSCDALDCLEWTYAHQASYAVMAPTNLDEKMQKIET